MTDPTPHQTTQAVFPWAAVRRTILAVLGFIAVMAPFAPDIARAAGIASLPWVVGALAVAAAITRVLAIPTVESWMREHLPSLAAAPPRKDG
jgi:hypothetical protein